jgi:uncharacterized SAM-binding protein YcdF (DUF218 family)
MSAQALFTTLLLPPLLLVLVGALAGLLAWRGRRWAGLLAAFACLGVLGLATPFASGWLRAGLEGQIPPGPAGPPPGAIVILSAEAVATLEGPQVGALTLERLRAGAALARASGLPVLVTGGVLGRGQPPIARLMAETLARDFGVTATWVEERAADTAGNARHSAAMLRAAGVGAVHVVTHGWHLPRAMEAFAREDFPAHPAPVRRQAPPTGRFSDFVPRADQLGTSWYMLREWAGRVVYAWRDG